MKSQNATPILRFNSTAWAKLLFLRDYGPTEVGGFGIAAAGDDLQRVTDLQLVTQVCSWTHVAFADDAVADYFEQQVDLGLQPAQFARIWLHTHPGDCPLPSLTDEATFDRVFGRADWAVMFILAKGGQSYARLRFNTGPCAEIEIPVVVDYSQPFDGCQPELWEQEYLHHVHPHIHLPPTSPVLVSHPASPLPETPADDWLSAWWEDLPGDDHPQETFHDDATSRESSP